ncbi:serine/threonine-protein kinase [Candidatus Uabimicrobium amorphum]|uniref:Serine/threonine protein kinase n=1 Tax=Uabimicrobium amorphum TaxID=2596890 RepID=A0A5S9IIM0_UABAM|nr:serine/threonine-protein kinase [Candidatus Uabimicrobium amorphum]BBM82528.1 serine/threonine protein kinase [Candidatus Uabimicrobium amorphum]
MTDGVDNKYSEVIRAASQYQWRQAYDFLVAASQQTPNDPTTVMLKKFFLNLNEHQYELAGSILDNAAAEDHNAFVAQIQTLYQKFLDENSKVSTNKKRNSDATESDATISESGSADVTLCETSANVTPPDATINEATSANVTPPDITLSESRISHDVTISEISEKTNVGGVSTTADTSKFLKAETMPNDNTPPPGVPSEATVVDSNIENPWEMESSAATMVMDEGEKPRPMDSFIDASTITKAHKIGPYHDLIEIGRGGMGIVYKAFDTENNRYVALKTIREEDVPEEIKKRFTREMDIVSKLNHPNIIRIFDKFFYNNRMFFSMEFIEGKTLKELQEQGRPFPLEETIDIVLKICDALEHAHDKSIIHRDLKPSNIMLDINNHVKVVDFGIAKKMDEEKYTRTGQVVGSIQYMPPEQMNGSIHDIDERSDVYTIGTILYELVMKTPPFPLPKIKDEMPKRLKSICLKCLHESKDGRYQSVTYLKKDLQQFSKTFQETKAQKTYLWLKRIAVTLIIFGLGGYSYFLQNGNEQLNETIGEKQAEISHLQDQLSQSKLHIAELQGDIHFRDQNYQQALGLYTQILNKTPNKMSALIGKGQCYTALRKYQEAMETFSAAIEIQRENANLYYLRGVVHHQLGDYPQAISDYEKTLLFANEHRQALDKLAEIHYTKQDWKNLHKYVKQIIDLHDIKNIDHSQAKAYWYLSNMYLEQKQRAKAIRHLLFAYFLDATISLNQKQRTALNFTVNNEAYLMRTVSIFHRTYPETSFAWLKKNANNKHRLLFTAAGLIKEEQKDYTTAKKLYEKAAKEPFAIYRTACLYDNGHGVEQNAKKAMDILNKAYKKRIRNGNMFVKLGIAYSQGRGVKRSNQERSLYFYQEAAKLNNYDAMYQLGIEEYKKKRFKQAFDWVNEAVKNDSTRAMVALADHFYKVGVYEMKDEKKATALRKKAAAIEDYYK